MSSRPAAGGGRWVEVDPDRVARWVAGFADRHGPPTVSAHGYGLLLSAPDGATAELHAPPGSSPPPIWRVSWRRSPCRTGSGCCWSARARWRWASRRGSGCRCTRWTPATCRDVPPPVVGRSSVSPAAGTTRPRRAGRRRRVGRPAAAAGGDLLDALIAGGDRRLLGRGDRRPGGSHPGPRTAAGRQPLAPGPAERARSTAVGPVTGDRARGVPLRQTAPLKVSQEAGSPLS